MTALPGRFSGRARGPWHQDDPVRVQRSWVDSVGGYISAFDERTPSVAFACVIGHVPRSHPTQPIPALVPRHGHAHNVLL